MRDRYRLGGLGNDQLLAALSALVKRERELLSDFLAHLAELDERRLFLDLGYPSLFAYCTEQLGLSKSAAGRRIAAASGVPEISGSVWPRGSRRAAAVGAVRARQVFELGE